jgi:hypothetical protein
MFPYRFNFDAKVWILIETDVTLAEKCVSFLEKSAKKG